MFLRTDCTEMTTSSSTSRFHIKIARISLEESHKLRVYLFLFNVSCKIVDRINTGINFKRVFWLSLIIIKFL